MAADGNQSRCCFYAKQGAAVHACGGEKPLSVEQLVKLVESGADADQVSADVTFPDLELDRPYLAPLAPRAATPEDVELLFDPPSRGSSPSPHWSALIPIQGARRRYIHAYMVCDGLTMGTVRIHGQQPSRATGCVEFFVWPWACALLEAYLQDPGNHQEQDLEVKSSGHALLVRHSVSGQVVARLFGYKGYNLTRATQHVDVEQAARTAKAEKRAQFAALVHLPGMRVVMAQVAARFGFRTLVQFLKSLYGVHFILQDRTNQTVYDWHSDGVDLGLMVAQEMELAAVAVQLSASMPTAMQVWGMGYVV